MNNPQNFSSKVLVLSPAANDGRVACEVLEQAGISAHQCRDMGEVCALMMSDAAALLISQEALDRDTVDAIQRQLDKQPAWSDIPMILITGSDVMRATEYFAKSGNISLLERPFSRMTLVRAVEVALRARKKQYEVRDLLTALQKSKDDADRANSAKSQFLANMSHEIRTPIGAIMGFVDLLKHADGDEAEKANYMGIIERNSQQLLRLIDDILDLSKVEAGKMAIEHIQFKVTDMLADFESVMTFRASEKGVQFQSSVDGLVPESIISDPTRLKQILSNIVGNAIKFTTKGTVDLRVRWSDEKLCFWITDTGVGLSESQTKRLFQPFVQADSSTTRQYGGTGLGLVLSRGLAETLGGKLELLESQPGVGSSFYFEIKPELPADVMMVGQSAVSLDHSAKKYPGFEERLSGMRVLLVEDSPDNQMLITTYLRKTGATIEVASDGQEGHDMATHANYDVVLMDVQMPKLDGHEATKKLRSEHYDRPIIALTAHAMKEERMKCYESGFTDFLTKPIHQDELIDVLNKYNHSH